MLAAGNALARSNIEYARTDCPRIIIGQFNSFVLASMKATSRAHTLKRISIGVVIPYGLDTRGVEIAGEPIPSARNNGGIQKNGDHEH